MAERSYTNAAKDKFEDVKEKTKEVAGDVRDKVSNTAEAAKEKLSNAAEATKEKAQELKETAGNKLGHNNRDCATEYKTLNAETMQDDRIDAV